MKKVLKIDYNVAGKSEDYLKVNPLPPALVESLNGLDYVIYGGYVRDLIAKKHNPNFKIGFQDVDIILLPNSFRKLIDSMKKHGYELGGNDHACKVYKHWGAVSHVYTLEKDNELRIQIVSPNPFAEKPTKEKLRDVMLAPVKAADLRCCAVAISPNGKLLELLTGAYKDCIDMKLIESPLAAHKYNLKDRLEKLKKRGWK